MYKTNMMSVCIPQPKELAYKKDLVLLYSAATYRNSAVFYIIIGKVLFNPSAEKWRLEDIPYATKALNIFRI